MKKTIFLFLIMTQTLPTQLFSNLSGKSAQDWCGSGLEVILLLLLMEVLCYRPDTTSHITPTPQSRLSSLLTGFSHFPWLSRTVGSAQRLCLTGDTGWRGNKGGRAGIIRDQAVTTISLRVRRVMCRCTLLQYRKFVFQAWIENEISKNSNYPDTYLQPTYFLILKNEFN